MEIFEIFLVGFYLQFQLYVSILLQKPHFTMLSFSFSIPRPITYSHSMTKTSLHYAHWFQFFSPRSHYMYPMAYKLLDSFQPSMERPHTKFMWESTFQGHVDHCWCDMWYNVHSHYNVHTMSFQYSTQILSVEHITSCWAYQWFPIDQKIIISSPMGTFKEHLSLCCSLPLQYAHH